MRAHVDASACAPARPVDRQPRLRSLVLLPAVVATAAAIHAPSALASTDDLLRQGTTARPQAARGVPERPEEAQPCRRADRRHAGVRRGHRKGRSAARRRPRIAAVKSTAARPRAIEAGSRFAGPTAGPTPLAERTLVASHPLAPDPFEVRDRALPDSPLPLVNAAAPRCKSAHPNALALAVANLGRELPASEPAMVEGAWPHCRGALHPRSSWQLASLGPSFYAPPAAIPPRLSGQPIHWRASPNCLTGPLRVVLDQVAAEFGPLTVNSTCRSRTHNARVGGAPRSYHLTGNAVDFRVRSHFREVLAFLGRFRSVGGLTHYGSGVFHIDTGPRRSWGPRSWGRHRARRRA